MRSRPRRPWQGSCSTPPRAPRGTAVPPRASLSVLHEYGCRRTADVIAPWVAPTGRARVFVRSVIAGVGVGAIRPRPLTVACEHPANTTRERVPVAV
jgi:hypothetical protein